MSKYIDVEKLIAEIRRIVEEETPISKGSDYYHGVADTADKLFSFINTLQQEQPEVDLEKEFQEYWYLHQYDHRLRRQVMGGHGKAVLENIARNFYELGLKAKEEK